MIPKIIHAIWVGPKEPPYKWLNTWKENHKDWEYKLWREKDIEELGLKNRETYEKYRELGDYAGMSDVARVEILWKYGGVYLDADTACKNKLDGAPFLKSDFFAVRENEHNLANGIIGSLPGHPLLEIYMIKLGQLTELEPAWKKSGPLLFTECVDLYGSQRIEELPTYTFLPETKSNEPIEYSGKNYALHFWGSTNASKYNY